MIKDIALNTSLNGISWLKKDHDERIISAISRQYELDDIIARLLSLRDINFEQINDFLNPSLKRLLPDPMHLVDMDKAVLRTVKAINNREKIVIFGDYDVDGATSSALLKRYFKMIDVEVEVYIPDRILEGYGPNVESVKKLKEAGFDLMITVDCGISAFEPLEEADRVGLEVIVIDHHLGMEKLPKAYAIVNPNRLDDKSEYTYLAAVGVSFLFAIAITTQLRSENYFLNHNGPLLLSLLDLVALGTVCDVVPLKGLNRAFVVQGLKVIAKRGNIGISTLLDVANVNQKPSSYHLGFVIGPRINAGGRVGESALGSEILSSYCQDHALNIAKKLQAYNEERKAIEIYVLDEAILQASVQDINDPCILVYSNNWHPGVIGIVASRLKEKYNKPAVVISVSESNNIGKASCRSIKGIDFGAAIFEAKNRSLISQGGGHQMAGGFTIHSEDIVNMHNFLNDFFKEKFLEISSNLNQYYDVELSCGGVNFNLAERIENIGPFGSDSNEPLFKINNCYVIEVKVIGASHIMCILGEKYSNKTFKAISFKSIGTKLGDFLLRSIGKNLSLIGYLRINEFNNIKTVQMIIQDVINNY